ncbi:condensation domain-containing protein [Plantactinospora sp. WMMC1484]|uniref:condensation domain-containing protein n=1 Tax=Plantactinospora sp. WMMC1484 TaxID=3404122 RepID=UPI003BF46697
MRSTTGSPAPGTDAGAPQRGPLCWGQQWAWHEQQLPAELRSHALLLRTFEPLPGVSFRTVRAAAQVVVARHASLRSTVGVDDNGRPEQRVWPASSRMYDVEWIRRYDEAAARLRQQMDIEARWPIRVVYCRRLVRGPARLGLVVHHIATDLQGFDLLWNEFRATVDAVHRGLTAQLPPAGRQPIDLATFEQSPAGAAASRRAVDYWLRHQDALAEVLESLRARATDTGLLMHVARVDSTVAARRLAQRLATGRTTETAIVVAAVSCALAEYLGRSTVPINMLVSNRHLPGIRDSVCCVAQSGLLCVEVSDPRKLDDVIPAAWRGSLAANRYGHYDSAELNDQMASFDKGGLHQVAAPPSVNIVPRGAFVSWYGPDPRPEELASRPYTSWLGESAQRCAGFYFHVRITDSTLAVELRTGGHLISADETRMLAERVVGAILGRD